MRRNFKRGSGISSPNLPGDTEPDKPFSTRARRDAWKSAPRWEPTAKFTTWLYTILRNLVFNECRRRARHKTTSLDAATDDADHPKQFADGNVKPPDTAMLDAEMQDAIERAIQELPEAQRMAVIMRRYQDVSNEEIAKVLDLTVPSVKSLLFRARTELREKLRKYLGE